MRTARENILWDILASSCDPFLFPNLLKMKNMDHEGYLLVEVVKSGESLVHPSGWVTPEASTCCRKSRLSPYPQSSKASRKYMFPMSRPVARHFKNHRVSKSEVTDVAIRPESRFPRTPKCLLSKKAIGVLDCVLVHF